MKRSALAVAALAVFAAVGWLVWQLFFVEAPRNDVAPLTTAHAAESATSADPSDAAPSTRAERTEDAKPALPRAEPPAAAPMPESYRRALSGLRGRLVEEDGKPIPGLRVELLELLGSMLLGDFEHALTDAASGPPDLVVAKGVSDADGVFELQGAIGGAFHGLEIDEGGARGTLRFIDRTLLSGEVADLGDIVLAPCVTWKGTVVDAEGKPVPGARVRATLLPPLVLQPGVLDLARVIGLVETRSFGNEVGRMTELPPSVRAWEGKLPFPSTRTNEDGTFELRGVPQGLATLLVDREGFTGVSKGPTPTGKRDRDVGRIELGVGRTITGRVVDSAGKPIAGAQVAGGVTIDPASLAITFPAAAPTDADGHFAVEHLSEQGASLCVAARAPHGDRWFVEKTDGSEPVTVTLPAGLALDVKLVTIDGAIVPDAELLLRSLEGPPFLTFMPPQLVAKERIVAVADGKRRIEGMLPGRYELLGRAPGLAMASTKVDVRSEPREATLEFTPPRELQVGVVDAATSQPIEYAQVTVGTPEHEQPSLLSRRTDVAGNATLSELPSRKVKVRVFHPAYAPKNQVLDLADPATTASRVSIALSPGAALHGRIHYGSQISAEPVLFVLEPQYGADRDIDDDMPRFALPGADGTFLLRGLAPGNTRWSVIPRAFSGDPQNAVSAIAESRNNRIDKRGQVMLVAGETAELDVDLDPAHVGAPGRITGIVRVRGSEKSYQVRLIANGEDVAREDRVRTVSIAPNRSFTIEPVKPGQYSLSIERPVEGHPEQQGPSVHQEWFELAEGEQHSLDLTFDPCPVEVQLVDAEGAPVPNQYVVCEWRTPRADGVLNYQNLNAMTDAEGVARFEAPNPGAYTLTASHPQKGRASAPATLPSRDRIVLKLDVGVPCRGRVELTPDPGGDAELWLTINLRREDDGYESSAWTQIGKGEREFELVGMREGKYRAQIYAGNGRHGQCDFDLGPNGDDHLVLKIKL
jgi:hypothetical protein